MTITVKSYSRHIAGKLVTVHGYVANRDQLIDTDIPPAHTVAIKQLIPRGEEMGLVPPGQYMNRFTNPAARGVPGLTAYFYAPGGHEKEATVRWRRSILPVRGAYKIPKTRPEV